MSQQPFEGGQDSHPDTVRRTVMSAVTDSW
jgi:hypothetical protein